MRLRCISSAQRAHLHQCSLSVCAVHFSTFAINPLTSAPPHGVPRGLINRYISMGLPPWAAWCKTLDRHAFYRLSDISPRSILPRFPHQMDVIWLNERVRERVRTSRSVQHVYRQLQYPWVKAGIHYSNILDHWVQIPMVQAAMFAVQQDGGFDNFILSRPGPQLRSLYGQRIRRHLLVRQKQTQKNFVLDQQAQTLAEVIQKQLLATSNEEEMDSVLCKYGISPEMFKQSMAKQLVAQSQLNHNAV